MGLSWPQPLPGTLFREGEHRLSGAPVASYDQLDGEADMIACSQLLSEESVIAQVSASTYSVGNENGLSHYNKFKVPFDLL